jgi:hypothetical protein
MGMGDYCKFKTRLVAPATPAKVCSTGEYLVLCAEQSRPDRLHRSLLHIGRHPRMADNQTRVLANDYLASMGGSSDDRRFHHS